MGWYPLCYLIILSLGKGGEEKIFLFLSTIAFISTSRGWKLVPPSFPLGSEFVVENHTVVGFDFGFPYSVFLFPLYRLA